IVNSLQDDYKRNFASSSTLHDKHRCRQIAVLGGGAGGCSIAAKFSSKLGKNKVIVIEPADRHYYQAMFTMIGGGVKKLDQSYKPMKSVLPTDALWIKDKVVEIEPRHNKVVTNKGHVVEYDYMIPGLVEALKDPRSGVCSNYSPDYVTKTFECIKRLKSGNAIFTYPNSPVKCAGAPQKIAYLTAHHCQLNNKKVQVIYHTSLPVIFKAPKYAESLWKVAEKRNVKVALNSDLIEVKPGRKEAVFQNLSKPEEKIVQDYEMLHVTPHHRPSELISKNKDISDASGFLAVNKDTMQHVKFANIFGIGDCTSLPTSKTGAAVGKESYSTPLSLPLPIPLEQKPSPLPQSNILCS
ncbi:hypothetical protein L9F63_010688, partial [Diploptera punctata]